VQLQVFITATTAMNNLLRNPINLTLIGPPGSGKGTYGKKLAANLRAILISVGDLLRDHVRRKTVIGVEAAEAQQRGELVSDGIVTKAIYEYLRLSPRDVHNDVGVVFDGYPRTLQQAKLISPEIPKTTDTGITMGHGQGMLISEKMHVHYAVSLQVPDDICLKKALGRRTCTLCQKEINVCDINEFGYRMPPILPNNCPPRCDTHWKKRHDDTEEIILRRIHNFRSSAHPLLSFYEKKGKLINSQPFNGVDDLPVLEKIVRTTVGLEEGGKNR
jgi:adenylate kinase